MFGRRKVAALAAEFLATGVLTLVVLSVQRSTIGVPYFVAIAAGLVLAMVVFTFGSVSAVHANPAITLAMWTARKVGSLTAVLFIIFQLLGAWAAYALYTYFVNSSLQEIGGTYTGRVLVAEAVGAFVFALGAAAVVYRTGLSIGTRAATLGVSLTLGVIIAAGAGIGLINPAVALGTRAWEVFGTMGWGTYVLGPILGAVIAVNLYGLLFAPAVEDEEAVVVEEVVVAETAVAAAPIATATAAKRASAKKPAAKAATTTRKTSAAKAKKPAAKRK
jgi:glycerol uptake facilitator protein